MKKKARKIESVVASRSLEQRLYAQDINHTLIQQGGMFCPSQYSNELFFDNRLDFDQWIEFGDLKVFNFTKMLIVLLNPYENKIIFCS